jgi:hypothetical protein
VVKRSLCTWWLKYRTLQVMFKMPPASLQTIIDTPNCVLEDRVQYITVHISNVFCDGYLQIINFVGIVFFTVIIGCTETSWSPCIMQRKLVVCYGHFGVSYQLQLQGSNSPTSSSWTVWSLKMWPIGLTEISVTNYPSAMRKIPK